MVKTAVLMATYNGASFIEKQLDSIRQQHLAPDYVLMRDDCSTDDTVKVVESYIDRYDLSGWKIVQNHHNLGWRLNFRQLLLDVQDYDVDYVFFSDQDDVWYLDKNERQVMVMEANQNIELLSADIDIKVVGEKATVPNNFRFEDEHKPISAYPKNFTYHNYRQGWTFCLRKTFTDRVVKHYSSGLVTSHDNLLAGISSVLETGYNLNSPVGVHVRHGGNASGNLLGVNSTNERHVMALDITKSYYDILVAVLKEQESSALELAIAYQGFYAKRLANAKGRKLWATLIQMVTQGRFYDSFSNRVRDLIFLFKK